LGSDSQKVQDNFLIGRHTHVCRESLKEKEVNCHKFSQKGFAEDFLFQAIQEASPPSTRRKPIVPNSEGTRARNDTEYRKISQIHQPMTQSSTQGEKKGLILAGSFYNVLKHSPMKDTSQNESPHMNDIIIKKSISTPGMYAENGILASPIKRDSYKAGSSVSIKTTVTSSDNGGDAGNESGDSVFSSKNGIKDDSFTDDECRMKRVDSKSMFDILDEVNENKNKLVDKFMEFNRSFIMTKTMPSH